MMARPSLSKGESINFFLYRLSVDFFGESAKSFENHAALLQKREQWPPPGLTLKKQKNGPEIFFHWFPLVVSGGGCGTDADTLPTIAACSKLHIH